MVAQPGREWLVVKKERIGSRKGGRCEELVDPWDCVKMI